MKKLLLLPFLFTVIVSIGQTAPEKYWVKFKDKADSPYSIDEPTQYLSYRAIDRRNRYNIPISTQDFPVNPSYLQEIKNLDASIVHASRWFNGATVWVTDLDVLDEIRALPFVSDIKMSSGLVGPTSNSKFSSLQMTRKSAQITLSDTSYYSYGEASNQIGMINGHILHNQGFQGQGMVIAVLDGGFSKADINPAFDSLWDNNQILGHWDFVKNTPLTFSAHNHGSQVLSLMGANLPGLFMGTAPKASYYLFRTEDGNSEYPIEEDNWVIAAEHADSLGVDLINTSLGYTRFTDPSDDYEYEDMDGNTTRITQAADIAASKGILVVTSASNEGSTDWQYIGAPGDADSVLTVGAVDADGNYAGFSSTGPTFDGRIKPNIVAQGEQAAVAGQSGNVFFGNGTSYSSPIICGMTACLWQSNKALNNMDIIALIEESGSQANQPDSLLGYGIPNYGKAFFHAQGIEKVNTSEESILRAFPNPFTSFFNVDFYAPKAVDFQINLMDTHGRVVLTKEFQRSFSNFHRIRLNEARNLAPGLYFLKLTTPEGSHLSRVIKHSN